MSSEGETSEAALDELIAKVYGAPWSPDGFASFVDALRQRLGAGYIGFVSKSPVPTPVIARGADPAWLADYRAHFAKVDPFCDPIAARLGVGELRSTDAIVPRQDLVLTEFYADFLARTGLERGLVGVLDRKGRDVGILTILFQRELDQEGRAELELLSRLMPHIRRAIMMCDFLAEARADLRFGERVLDELSGAAFVLTPSGTLVRTNEAADRMLSRCDGIAVDRDGIAATHPDDNRVLRREVGRALPMRAGAPRPIVTLRRPSCRRPLVATIGPLTSRIGSPFGLAAERVLVLVRDPERLPRASARAICRALGLTLAESKVVALLVEGSSIQEIARKIGTSPETVRSQVKSTFAKTGVHRQSELVRLVLLTVPVRED